MSLTDLAARRARRGGPGTPMEATVLAAPAAPDALLRVEVDAQAGIARECPWMARGAALPAPGDAALVVESDAGELWVIAWWPQT
ncbi:hypothetical protein [Miltoncostaea marina]|uniref:hypothetical protein n=1 Tax=Miltoncostaea marina TaxID=2843215 RepID=UPI001C3DA7F9|nr:hypothetical protein [Miltoncostaea marina]